MARRAKNKLGFIEGTLMRPTTKDDEEFFECHTWNMANSMLCYWLLNVIDPKLRMMIAYCETARSMWDDLWKRCEMANTPKMHQLKENIANCKQGDMEIGELYSKLVNLCNEMSNLIKAPVRTCAGCKCGAAGKLVVMCEADKAHQFLMGLNDDAYSTIRSQILTMDHLPSLDRIFNITQQEENYKRIVTDRENHGDATMAFVVKC